MSKTITVSDEAYNMLLKRKEEFRQDRNEWKRETASDEKTTLEYGWPKASFDIVIKNLIVALESNLEYIEELESQHPSDCKCDECVTEWEEREQERREWEAEKEHARFMYDVFGLE